MTTVTTAVSLTTAQNWYLTAITAGSLVACVAFTVVRWRRFGVRLGPAQRMTLHSRMGQGQWDFSQSFATNIAIIGSVLTLILNSNAAPGLGSAGILPGGAYAGLGIFFGTLVIVAPLLYNGTADRVSVSLPAQRDTAAEYHGTVRGFLVATVVTQWGLLGSVITVFLTLLELEHAGSLSLTPVILLAITLAAAMYFFARYSWVKIGGTLTDQFDAETPAAAQEQEEQAREVPAREAPTQAPAGTIASRPGWTLL